MIETERELFRNYFVHFLLVIIITIKIIVISSNNIYKKNKFF